MSHKPEPHVDMSDAAISARIAQVADLNRLCESLGEAGRGIASEPQKPELDRRAKTEQSTEP